MEEAQTLLTVVQTVEVGREAPRAHWRAGFWPRLWRGCQLVDAMRCGGGWERWCYSWDVLCGEHIAEEDFFYQLGLDA